MTRLFDGLNLVEPGVVNASQWRPDTPEEAAMPASMWCGVARKENAFQLKALQQTALKNLAVKAGNLSIIDYDQEVKTWFTALASGQLSGIITGKGNPELDVDLNPVVVTDGIDVNVYKVTISISPVANQAYPLKFASSSTKTVVKSWGLIVET